ncbi:MAG: PKD domain-containing protein [Ruminobacter sp.]|nr:PKD domain-containing protein [Ruminobacter sp.]
MYKLSKYALAVLASFAVTACGGGGGSSGSSGSSDSPATPTASTASLDVQVQAQSSDIFGGNVAAMVTAANDDDVVACIDENADFTCSNEEVHAKVDKNTGKATLEWDPDKYSFNDATKVIVTRNSTNLLLHYTLAKVNKTQDGQNIKYDNLYMSTLTTLQDKYGSAQALKEGLGLPKVVNFAATDIVNYDDADDAQAGDVIRTINDSSYQLGYGLATAQDTSISENAITVTEIKTTLTNVYNILNQTFQKDNITYDVAINIIIGNVSNGKPPFNFDDIDTSNKAPISKFDYITNNLTVQFTNHSTDPENDALTYTWIFGDGSNKSTEVNPTHTFPKSGVYTVTLYASDKQSSTPSHQQVVVTSPNDNTNTKPDAKFTYNVSGLTVNFEDKSTDADGDLLAVEWDFGDGTTSKKAKPTHTYAKEGTYKVILTVDDGSEKAQYIKEISISVDPTNHAPVADFTVTSSELTVTITNKSTDADGDILTYTFDMGDGNKITKRDSSFTYTYQKDGTYTITLVANDGTVNSEPKPHTVTVSKSIVDECSDGVCRPECPQNCSSDLKCTLSD